MSRGDALQSLEPIGPPAPAIGSMALPVIVPLDVELSPRRAGNGRTRFAVALLVALGIHAAAFAGTVALMRDSDRFGSGGIELDVITVGLVDASALEARPSTDAVGPAPAGATEPVRQSDGAQAILPVDAAPPAAPAVVPEKLTDTVVSAEPSDVQPAPQKAETAAPAPDRRDAIDVASIAPPQQPASADGGAAAKADLPAPAQIATAAKARAGVVTAYKKSVAEALGKNPPKRVGVTGQAVVSFRISSNGAPNAVKVMTSSGSSRIDDAALAAVRGTSFSPPPAALSEDERTFNVPYRFK